MPSVFGIGFRHSPWRCSKPPVALARPAATQEASRCGILPQIPARHVRRRRIAEAIVKAEAELIKQAHRVGYSRLAGADEERALARLRALRSDLIDPSIALTTAVSSSATATAQVPQRGHVARHIAQKDKGRPEVRRKRLGGDYQVTIVSRT
jgi:hypothetical protein